MNIEFFFEFLKKHLFPLLISIGITILLFFFLIPYCKGIKRIDHWQYIVSGDENYSLNKVGEDHLQFMLSTMEYYEELSYEILMDLWDIMEKLQPETDQEETEESKKNQKLYKMIYKIANQDYAIIRMLMELDNIYCELAKSDKGRKNTRGILVKKKREEILKTFYTAYDLILQFKMNERLDDRDRQQKLKTAYMQFKKIYQNTGIFPENLRENIEIETLQFLTYCSFALKDENKPSEREQKKWNSYAKEIREGKKDLNGSEYRRKYYWVDLSAFFANLKDDGDIKKAKKAENAFNAMVRDIYDIKFLKSKFKQHQSRVEDESRERLNEYIEWIENPNAKNEIDQTGSGIWPWWNGEEWDETKKHEILMQLHESKYGNPSRLKELMKVQG